MWAGFALLALLFLGIWLVWLRHSQRWDNQEKLARFLRDNPASLVAKNVGFHLTVHARRDDTMWFSAENWSACNIYCFKEGLILTGEKNYDGFEGCILLRRPSVSWRIFPGCLLRGHYQPPKYSGKLVFETRLSESILIAWGAAPVTIEIFVDQGTANKIFTFYLDP
jgi:hypothetical protein